MATKKKGGEKKTDGDQAELKEKNEMIAGEVQLLKWQIAMEQEKADRSRAGQNECREKMREIHTNFENEGQRALLITGDMKGQYSAMVKDRDDKINDLRNELLAVTEELTDREKGIREMTRAKDSEIEEKETEIRGFRKRIDDLSEEFAAKLKSILDKMQERIELANTQWDSEAIE